MNIQYYNLIMTTFYRSALVRYDSDFHTTQFLGQISDGIYFLPLGDKSMQELSEYIEIPHNGHKIVIWIDHKLLEHRPNREKNNEFYHLMQKMNIFCKIYIAPHCGVLRPSQYKYSALDTELHSSRKSILAHHWDKFSVMYDKQKLLYRLFGISTIDTADYIFNVMNSTVALEGLLLQGEKSENAYKFRVRGAFLLGKSQASRTKYYQIFKLAYEMRSAIAHANDKEKTRIRNKIKSELSMTLKVFNEQLIQLNRVLLQQLAENPHVYDDLDGIVLKG